MLYEVITALYIIGLLKGWFYVIITAIMGFILIYKGVKRIQLVEKDTMKYIDDLKRSNQELEVAYEEIFAAEDTLKTQLAEIEIAKNSLAESRITSYNVCYTKLLRIVAAEHGLVSGNGDGTFRPDDYVTVAELCVMLSKAYSFKHNIRGIYSKLSSGKWYSKYVQNIFNAEIIV